LIPTRKTGSQRRLIVSASVRLNDIQIVADPEVGSFQGVQGSAADIRQLILNTWWYLREIVACNDTVTFEIAQRECQHALGDIIDLFPDVNDGVTPGHASFSLLATIRAHDGPTNSQTRSMIDSSETASSSSDAA